MSHSLSASVLTAGLTAMWIGLAAPAEAATVVVPASVTFTATGTVNMGVNAADLFGGGNLTGLAFVATYVFQTSPSTVGPYYCCSGSSTGPGGTLSFLNPRTASTINVSATITINGDTFAFSGTGDAFNLASGALGGDERGVEVSGKSSGGAETEMGSSVLRTPSLWLGVPGATDIFRSNTVSGATGFEIGSEFGSDGTQFLLNVSSISSSDITTMVVFVPEFSTWTMMLFGFAGLGFVGWRAQRKNVTAAAWL